MIGSDKCNKCGEPTVVRTLWADGVPLETDAMCAPCFEDALEGFAAVKAIYRALVDSGMDPVLADRQVCEMIDNGSVA